MISRFLVELPIKSIPEGADRFLIEDITNKATKTTSFSALKEYLGITAPGGATNIGVDVGNVNIGNGSGYLNLSGNNINVISTNSFNLNPVFGETTNLNTGIGPATTTIGNDSASNNLILNSRSITAPNQVVNADSSVLTRIAADSRYGNMVSITLNNDGTSITTNSYSSVISVNLETGITYEFESMVFLNKTNLDVDQRGVNTRVKLAYSSTTSIANLIVTKSSTSQTSAYRVDHFIGSSLPDPAGIIESEFTETHAYLLKGVIKTTGAGTLSLQVSKDGVGSGTIIPKAGTYITTRKIA